uniref:Class I SAM-dependent methyltransferase n=1 Tax=candidate division WOR-3 bacterium TaxID=2052148 RepID=A0A7C2P225_UNCW3
MILLHLLGHGYKEYRDLLYERILGRPLSKPWMKYREIEIIEEILKKLEPIKCLEWGAGYSTLYFPKILNSNSTWIAIEHEKEWFEKIRMINRNPNVEIHLVLPNKYPWSDEYKDGDYSDLKDYIEYPTKFGKFDFILIDGRARKYCIMKAYELIKDKGVVVLHDANRTYYHEPFRLFNNSLLFTDYREGAGGIWVGSKKLKLENVIDVERRIKLWKTINKVGRLLKI